VNQVKVLRDQLTKGRFGAVLRVISKPSLGFRHRLFIIKDPLRSKIRQKSLRIWKTLGGQPDGKLHADFVQFQTRRFPKIVLRLV
jgi:hypothetical protein